MASPWDIDAVSVGFAEAATDPSQWSAALDRVVDAVGATGILVIPLKVEHRLPGLLHSSNVAETADRYLREGWCRQDLRNRGIPQMLSRGITVDQDFITSEEMRKSDFYNELLLRDGLYWFAGVLFHADKETWCLSIQRSASQGPFTPAEQSQLLALRAPLTTAATVAQKFALTRAAGGLDAFDMMDTAAMLVDRQGQILRINRIADDRLGDGLRIMNRRVTADDPETSRALAHLIGSAARDPGEGGAVMSPVAVARPGRLPLVVYALPLAGVMTRDRFGPAGAIVVVRDLDNRNLQPTAHLSALFGMTASEAKLAALLAAGEPLATLADRLGIAKETARSRLKVIFAKTGVNRQAELAALLGRLLDHRDV
jgi:DNA-binding CsgD family transcriptional regulator